MQSKLTPILFFAILFPFLLQAQITPECGFDSAHQKKLLTDPKFKEATEKVEKLIYEKTINMVADRDIQGTVYTIPVVVHVMYLPGDNTIGTGSNISDAQVQAGLDHLNQAFRNIGDYAGGPYYTDAGIASADVEIEFCLAVRDPNGNPTTGINRISTDYSNLHRDDPCGSGTEDDCLKALSFWDSNDYMNVWIVNEICLTSNPEDGCGVAGYAYYSSAHGSTYDGVVSETGYWGSSTSNSKVHIHEVGHYLNLKHTFEGGCSETDCLTGGDLVCDTPPDNSYSAVSCANNNTANTCSNDATITNSPFTTDVQDMYENYMDYGYQSCQNTFTPGQVTRMRTALTGVRASLLSSDGCTPAIPPTSDFIVDASSGCPGTSLTFQDNSANGTSSWSWSFPGGSPSSSTIENPTITYNNTGTYDVTLTASNGAGTGTTETKTDFITIYNTPTLQCAISASNANTSGNNYGFGIKNVALLDFSKSSGGTVADGAIYIDNVCLKSTELSPNRSYNLTVEVGPVNDEDIRAYIDYNNDGDFNDSDELVFSVDNQQGTVTGTINTPANPATGVLLTLRVISDYSPNTITSCTTPQYGQVEDYGIFFAAPLPVELMSFTARPIKETTQLQWQTASETSNNYFTLEHSTDGVHFESLANIDTKGNGSSANDYSFNHRNPATGTNHYRLTQTDLDGQSKVLGIRSVHFKSKDVVVHIHPNPIQHNALSLTYSSPKQTEVMLLVLDLTGRILFKQRVNAAQGLNHFNLPVGDLSNGVYFLRTEQSQDIQTIRFTKAE